MSNQFIGEIRIFPYNFAPRDWATCSGQLMSIAQNTALFSILGTTYGGDGQTTFALPNLQGRASVGWGSSAGLGNVSLGQTAGEEGVVVSKSKMPTHTHLLYREKAAGNVTTKTSAPQNNQSYLSGYNQTSPNVSLKDTIVGGGAYTPLHASSGGLTGGDQAHENRQPFLVLLPCIALFGIFPSRN